MYSPGTGRAGTPRMTIRRRRTAYGRTKLAGERAALSLPGTGYVVRTAWLYGAHGPNFVRTMITGAVGSPARVVTDQRGQPTWSLDVAEQIVALIQCRRPGRHVPRHQHGETTWYGLAREIFRLPAPIRPGRARHQRRLPPPGRPAGMQRAWSWCMGRPGPRAIGTGAARWTGRCPPDRPLTAQRAGAPPGMPR